MFMVRGTNLFDGSRTVETATVTIEGEKIVAVGQDRPPPGAEVIELGDATLLPGLVDCHQHLCFETLSEDAANAEADALLDQARRSARRALAAGVTTVRDLGDKSYVSLALRHEHDLPTLLCAGPPITVPNGHCWYLGGEIDSGGGESTLRAAVRERAQRGCNVVKIMMTGGYLTPTNPMWESQFSLDELRIVVDEAHQHELSVAAHCHGVGGVEHAVRARVDSIEHCSFLDENLDVNATAELLALVADSRIPVSLTIGRLPSYPVAALVERNLARFRSTCGRLHELGAVLVCGTDAGIGHAKPHDVLPYALADLVGFGLTPAQGLRAMTREGAGACGVGRTKGQLAPGFDADVLALRGDPLDDIDAIHEPMAIWCRGSRVR